MTPSVFDLVIALLNASEHRALPIAYLRSQVPYRKHTELDQAIALGVRTGTFSMRAKRIILPSDYVFLGPKARNGYPPAPSIWRESRGVPRTLDRTARVQETRESS